MKELVVRSTGCRFDICLRDGEEIQYLYTDVDAEWVSVLVNDYIERTEL